jgi:hypothetical protein
MTLPSFKRIVSASTGALIPIASPRIISGRRKSFFMTTSNKNLEIYCRFASANPGEPDAEAIDALLRKKVATGRDGCRG